MHLKKILCVGLTMIFMTVLLPACNNLTGGSPTPNAQPLTWQEQYDLGIRYLSEGNYEEAILTFIAAIEINPKKAEAYMGLADAYIGIGQLEKAMVIIDQGVAACGETPELIAKREMLQTQQQSPEEIAEATPWLLFDAPLLATDVTLGGMPLWECTLGNVAEQFPDGNMQSEHMFFTEDFGLQTDIAPVYVSFIKTEFRHFEIGMPIEDVLKELGISKVGQAFATGASELQFNVQGDVCTSASRVQDESSGAYSENIVCFYSDIPKYDHMIIAFGFAQGKLVHMEASVRMFEEREQHPTTSLSGIIRFNDDVYPELKNIDHTKEARPRFGLFLNEPVTLTVGGETYTVSEVTLGYGADEDLNRRQAEYVGKQVVVTGTLRPRSEVTTWMEDGIEVQRIMHNCNGPLGITMESISLQ